MRYRLIAPIMIAAVSLSGLASADLYRFVDKNGTVHITNLKKRRYKRFVKSHGLLSPRKTKNRKKWRPRSRVRHHTPATVLQPSLAPINQKLDKFYRYDKIVKDASRRYQIPVPFIKAVMKVESGFNPRATSHVGAQGLMQLMPRTAAALGVKNSYDPRQNILGGTKFLRILANRFNGDLALILSGYHAGEGAVIRKGGIPFAKTHQYVRWVLAWYYRYKKIMPAY